MYTINNIRKVHQLIVIIGFYIWSNIAFAGHHEFEDAANLGASKVLSPDLLKGEHHSVQNVVRSDGYLNSDSTSVGLGYNFYGMKLSSNKSDVNGYLKVRHHGPAAFFALGF